MASQEHLNILKQGVDAWNTWRETNPNVEPDLSGADFCEPIFSNSNIEDGDFGADFSGVDFSRAYLHDASLLAANLAQANLEEADLCGADLSHADLTKADLTRAKLIKVNLSQATLKWADLPGASLVEADLSFARLFGANLSYTCLKNAYLIDASLGGVDFTEADLTGANFDGASIAGSKLVRANLTNAKLVNCSVYGASIWDVILEGTVQQNLYINAPDQTKMTVDDIEIAQFIHLLLHNKNIRNVLDAITSKVILILGRFIPERKAVLDALRDELRNQNYSPILFDFEKPSSRDFTETVRTLAHLSRFIIADLSEPSSIPQELQAIVPDLEVPVQPLLLEAKREYSMFVDFRKYDWVLPIYLYKDRESLIASLKDEIIEPAEKKARELAVEKAERLKRP